MGYVNQATNKLPDKDLRYQWKTKYSDRELRLVEGKIEKLIFEQGYELSGRPPITPGWVERIGLYLQNKTYRFKYNIKKYGVTFYPERYLANKFGGNSWRDSCHRRVNPINIKGVE